jgi:hypothetical protein
VRSAIPQQPDESIPESVRYLDALFDQLVCGALGADDGLLDFWMRLFCDVKRRIASVPPSAVDGEARAALAGLRRDLSGRSVRPA